MSENQVAVINKADLDLLAQYGLVSNTKGAERVNSVSIKGSKWRYSIGGETKTVEIEVEGEKMAAPSVKTIILNQIPSRSYAYFQGGFVDGENKAPVCWSTNSKNPDSDATEPQHTNCAMCPQRVVGSVVSDNGNKARACRESKRIAIVIAAEPSHTPLRMQLPVTSLWEEKASATAKEAQGWFAFDAYTKHLANKGIPHTCFAETIMKFDDSVSGVKVLFKFNGRLPEEAIRKLLPVANSEEVRAVLGMDKYVEVAATPVHKQLTVMAQPVLPVDVEIQAQPQAAEKPAESPVPAVKAEKKAPKAVSKPVEVTSAEADDQLSDW